MLKVLVADEDIKRNSSCCQYLSKDKSLDVIGVSNGINAITKYHEIQANMLIINSDFEDKGYIQIINELSNTPIERKNCNIILTLKNDTKKLELDFMSKIYKLFYSPVNYRKYKKRNRTIQFRQYNIL